jgi:hypothetical protein
MTGDDRARSDGPLARGPSSGGDPSVGVDGLPATVPVTDAPDGFAGPDASHRAGRVWRILVIVAVLVLAVAASASALFRSAPDARWYYAANTGVLLRLQPFPQSREVAVRSFVHSQSRGDAPVFRVTWYTTYADYVVPHGTSPKAIVQFYRFQLEPLWACRSLSQDVVRGDTTVARMPGLQASQGDMFVTVLTSSMVGMDGRQRPHPRYSVQVDYRVQ